MTMNQFTPAAIIDEAEAGRSAKVRKQLESLLKGVQKSTLDIAELFFEVKSKGYYSKWGYDTFASYVKELDIKVRKAHYLVRIVEVMNEVQIDRATYEPVGLSKLREITSLEPKSAWTDPDGNSVPVRELIVGMVAKAHETGLEDIKQQVRVIKGLTGENELVWINILMNKAAKEQVVLPAFDKAKANIGTMGYDDDGKAIDASDGRALEVIAIEYLNNPQNDAIPRDVLDNEPVGE